MSYTETELNEALKQAEATGNEQIATFCREKLRAMKGVAPGKMPNMAAYLQRCISRCRPKGGK